MACLSLGHGVFIEFPQGGSTAAPRFGGRRLAAGGPRLGFSFFLVAPPFMGEVWARLSCIAQTLSSKT